MGSVLSIARKLKVYMVAIIGEALHLEKDDFYTYMLSEYIKDAPYRKFHSGGSNSNYVYEVSPQRMSTLRGIIEALTDANVTIIGVCGTHSIKNANLLEKFIRRAKRDNLFDMIVMASVTRKPDLRRIQGELADAFGLTMEEKKVAERARRLRDRIKMEQKILVVLQDLCKELDLEKIGIPFGADHTGCKILLTSTSEEILSNQMHAQKVFIWK